LSHRRRAPGVELRNRSTHTACTTAVEFERRRRSFERGLVRATHGRSAELRARPAGYLLRAWSVMRELPRPSSSEAAAYHSLLPYGELPLAPHAAWVEAGWLRWKPSPATISAGGKTGDRRNKRGEERRLW
jgi:hypothetical protein